MSWWVGTDSHSLANKKEEERSLHTTTPNQPNPGKAKPNHQREEFGEEEGQAQDVEEERNA